MTGNDERLIDNVVDLYKLRICAALDQMPLDEIRSLVAEIESQIANADGGDGTRQVRRLNPRAGDLARPSAAGTVPPLLSPPALGRDPIPRRSIGSGAR